MPVQMQAAGGAVVQRNPSDEVPDLDEEVVKKLNEALARDDKDKALKIILDALVAKDKDAFDPAYLEGGKLYAKGGGDSNAGLGPNFKTWLEGELAKGPEEIKSDSKACRKYLDTLEIPKGLPDIRINIAEARFISAPRLYSVVRHEFIHYAQFRKDPLRYISRYDFPKGYANPSTDSQGAINEVEAHVWEAENMEQTGIDKDPQYLWNTFENLNDYYGEINVGEADHLTQPFKDARNKLWKAAVSGYCDQGDPLLEKATAGTIVEDEQKKLDEVWRYIQNMWGYRAYRNQKDVTALEPRVAKYEAHYQRLAEQKAKEEAKKEAEAFGGKIKTAEARLDKAANKVDAYNSMTSLLPAWRKLDADGKTEHEAAYTALTIRIWNTTWEYSLTDIEAAYEAKEERKVRWIFNEFMIDLFNNGKDLAIPQAELDAKEEVLDAWRKKLRGMD